MDLASANAVLKRTANIPVTGYIKIRTYLPTEEKIEFVKKYHEYCRGLIDEGTDENVAEVLTFVYFNLLVAKYYTDLEFDMTLKSFDLLMEDGLLDRIVEVIGRDYSLLVKFIRI